MVTSFFVNIGALVIARAFTAVSQVLVLPILARYVPVEEFAIMALAMTAVLFGNVLSDAGLGRSLIRAQTYDAREWSSVFWFLVGVGVVLTLGVVTIAPAWAWAFDQPRLPLVLIALSVIPMMNAASAVHNAAIERDERHVQLSVIQIPTTFVSLAIATALAIAGYGIWALVWQQIALAAGRLLGLIIFSRFRPDWYFDWQQVRPHLRFARDALIVSAIQTIGRQAPVLAIARLLGETQLGYFAMSQRFTRLPMFGLAGPASTVIYVRLARAQADHARMARIYLASIRLLALALLPSLLMVAIASEAVFTILLGMTWAPMGPIFALSVPGFALDAAAAVCLGALFRARGETGLHVQYVLESTAVLAVLTTVTAFHSVELVALGFTVWALLMVPRGWILAQRIVPLSVTACGAALGVPLAVTLVFVALHALVVYSFAPGNWMEVGLAVGGCIASFSVAVWLTLDELKEDLSLLQSQSSEPRD